MLSVLFAVFTLAATSSFAQSAFVRGDADASGGVDITDPIRILGYLFAGSPADLGCDDAADVDDSGRLEITDPIALLNFLFAGESPPQAPFPGCGFDPTDDDGLGCAAFASCESADGATTILETSPYPGEDGVAVTRETHLTFSHGIDRATVTKESVKGELAGRTLPARLHVGPDGRRVTLFWEEQLPASARITSTLR